VAAAGADMLMKNYLYYYYNDDSKNVVFLS